MLSSTTSLTRTFAVPSSWKPSVFAAALDRSMMRSRANGPRSFTLSFSRLPFSRLVTSTMLGSGKVRCAAEIACMSNCSPLAVASLWNCGPYHEAMPVSS